MTTRTQPNRVVDVADDRDADVISPDRLRSALLGRDARVPRHRVLHLAALLPDGIALLTQILGDSTIQTIERRTAAIQLAYAGGPDATAALRGALAVDDEHVLSGVIKALGWIGDADVYGPVMALRARPSPRLASLAEVAARLIAHRHGLPAADLPAWARTELLAPPSAAESQPVLVNGAPADDAQRCIESIASRSFGLRFTASHTYEIRCARTQLMLLLHADLVRTPHELLRRRSIPFVLAMSFPLTDSYSIALLAFATPGETRVMVARATGQPIYAGSLQLGRDQVGLTLASVVRPGAFPIRVEAALRAGRVSVGDAVSGPVKVPKRLVHAVR